MAIKTVCNHAARSHIGLSGDHILLVAWELYMTPSRLEYTKTPPQISGSSYFLIEKSIKTAFFKYKNLLQDIILTHL
jgi:hypothetical protein